MVRKHTTQHSHTWWLHQYVCEYPSFTSSQQPSEYLAQHCCNVAIKPHVLCKQQPAHMMYSFFCCCLCYFAFARFLSTLFAHDVSVVHWELEKSRMLYSHWIHECWHKYLEAWFTIAINQTKNSKPNDSISCLTFPQICGFSAKCWCGKLDCRLPFKILFMVGYFIVFLSFFVGKKSDCMWHAVLQKKTNAKNCSLSPK